MIFGQKYDCVYSFGQWCATSMLLKKLGLRSASGPFDWLGPGLSVAGYVDLVVSDFKGFLLKENLRRVGENKAAGHAYYWDDGTQFELRHDFSLGAPFDEEYAKVRDKYDRRIARMKRDFIVGGRILLVHYRGPGHYGVDELVPAMEKLRTAFPRSSFDLLVLESERSGPELSYDEPGPGIVRVTGDFYECGRFDMVLGNERLVLKVLRRIRMRGKWRNLLHMRLSAWKKKLSRKGHRGNCRT